MSAPGIPIQPLRPMSEAPITGPVVDVLVATTDRAGRNGWLIAHYAEGGGEDQPPLKGWFFWTGFDFRQVEDQTLRGWISLPVQPPAHDPGEMMYACAHPGCDVKRTKAQGGTVFTVCDEHWATRSSPSGESANQPGVVNLTKLIVVRSKMTPGEYELAAHDEGGPDGALHIVSLRRHEGGAVAASILVAIMPDDMRADDDAAGLVATHNAAPGLIEVARAAKVVSDQDGIRDSKGAYALRRALAKVTL